MKLIGLVNRLYQLASYNIYMVKKGIALPSIQVETQQTVIAFCSTGPYVCMM